MNLNIADLRLSVCSPAVVGAALKILQAGGSGLEESQARRAAGSPYLYKQHRQEIDELVIAMEDRLVAVAG